MRFIRIIQFILLVAVFIYPACKLKAQVELDFEGGIVATGYNNVRIPGEGGTYLSLSDQLSHSLDPFLRLQATYHINSKNSVLVLFAPLMKKYSGSVNSDIVFMNRTFPQFDILNATYKFNSYRVTYSYQFFKNDKLTFSAGLTIKVRDAFIRFESGAIRATKYDLGVVPLININFQYKLLTKLGFIIYGDALAAPQGRAEDIFTGFTYLIRPSSKVKIGYRILEGGANNKTVYTFSMFHYIAAGVLLSF